MTHQHLRASQPDLGLHSLYLPYSKQRIYYDADGNMVCGWDTVHCCVWVVAKDPIPADEIIRFVLADNQPVQLPLPGWDSVRMGPTS
jgi:hypothetical protein